jgi:3-hydroxyisobutyrate dehydrogenase
MAIDDLKKVAVLGFGEVGRIFASDLAAQGVAVSVFDVGVANPKFRDSMLAKAAELKLVLHETLCEATKDADLVISVVTAAAAIGLAKMAAEHLKPGQIYLDLNSVSPGTKIEIDCVIVEAGAAFVEGAVMAPVKPQRLKSPISLGGARAAELSEKLRALGMATTMVSERIGVASATKMCRSIVMKGLAALALESLFTARRYHAEDAVLASFDATYPTMGWKDGFANDLIFRAAQHSRRRSAEMREAASTVEEAGFSPHMALATAELQDWVTAQLDAGRISVEDDGGFKWTEAADATQTG